MTKITIFGAGITGMSIATLLIKDTNNTITIVARDLPGDPPSQGWASPWACAAWVALGSYCSAREQQMQLDALEYWKRLAVDEPEGGVRIAEMVDVAGVCESGDSVSSEFMKRVPGFRVLEGLGEGLVGAGYESVVVDPGVFLPWLRKKLEADGVRFQRIGTVTSLGEINGMGLGHDVLINASGAASLTLEDVRDEGVVVDRTYTVVVKLEYDGMFVRREKGQYTYMFGRGDGTAVVGGLSEPVDMPARKREEVHQDLLGRAHYNLPEIFLSCNPDDYTVVADLVGIRPLRPAQVRVEREVIDGQTVLHAYGTTVGGYIYSFGLAREVARLLDDHGLSA